MFAFFILQRLCLFRKVFCLEKDEEYKKVFFKGRFYVKTRSFRLLEVHEMFYVRFIDFLC